MTESETEFEEQLLVFASECRDAIRYTSTLDAIYAQVFQDAALVESLNRAPIVWSTILDSLQKSAVMTVGRIFDPKSDNYSINRLLNFAERNLHLFSRELLRTRMTRSHFFLTPRQIDARVLEASEPSALVFKEIRKSLQTHRNTYETELRPMRHKLYAHRIVADQSLVTSSGGAVAKLREVVTYLEQLRMGLQGLFSDGWEISSAFSAPVLGQGSTTEAISGQVRLILRSLQEGQSFLPCESNLQKPHPT